MEFLSYCQSQTKITSQGKWVPFEFVPEADNIENVQDWLNFSEMNPGSETSTITLQQYENLGWPIHVIGLILFIISIVLQFFAIKYEKFEMDPLKRDFTNQVNFSFT